MKAKFRSLVILLIILLPIPIYLTLSGNSLNQMSSSFNPKRMAASLPTQSDWSTPVQVFDEGIDPSIIQRLDSSYMIAFASNKTYSKRPVIFMMESNDGAIWINLNQLTHLGFIEYWEDWGHFQPSLLQRNNVAYSALLVWDENEQTYIGSPHWISPINYH